jgi:hypothetical protein
MKKHEVKTLLTLSKGAQQIYVRALETQSNGTVFLPPLAIADLYKMKKSKVYAAMNELVGKGVLEKMPNRAFYKLTDGKEKGKEV